MFVISIRNTKKKLRFAAMILIVLLLLAVAGYIITKVVPSSAEVPIVAIDEDSDSANEGHYPGEPIRVYNSLEGYWQDKVSGIADME